MCLACFPRQEEMNHKLFATAGWPRLVSPSPAQVAKVTNLPNLPPQLQPQSKHRCLSPSPVTSRKRLKCIAEEFLCVMTHAVPLLGLSLNESFGLIGRDKMNQTHSVSDPIWKTGQQSRPLRCLWTGQSSVSLARYVFAKYMTTFSQEGLEIGWKYSRPPRASSRPITSWKYCQVKTIYRRPTDAYSIQQ